MNVFKRLFGRVESSGVSLTKVGTLIAGVCRAVMEVTGPDVDKWLNIGVVIGLILAGNGVRDAIGKAGK